MIYDIRGMKQEGENPESLSMQPPRLLPVKRIVRSVARHKRKRVHGWLIIVGKPEFGANVKSFGYFIIQTQGHGFRRYRMPGVVPVIHLGHDVLPE
jgi:hypothetical protein